MPTDARDPASSPNADRLPSIGIVMPSLNQAPYLREAIESLLRQDYPRLEIVVMDGGSTDDSVEIIRSFADRLVYWQSRPDRGQSAAINEGMRHCGGEIVTWLNSDDYHWGDALWRVARARAAHPEHDLYIGNGLRHHQDQGTYSLFCPRHVALNRHALRYGLDYVLQPATFFSRRAWEEAGGLDESLRYCMDWDLILRVAAHRAAVTIDEVLAVSREWAETKTSRGALERAFEIARMVGSHTGQELTRGSLYYLMETALGATAPSLGEVRSRLWSTMQSLRPALGELAGVEDGFPETGDPQDRVDLAIAGPETVFPRPRTPAAAAKLPTISIVTPSFNQARFLAQAIESILAQRYPRLETLVFDGGSADGSVDVLRRYADRLTGWTSEPDRGPAHAINKGFARARGEVVGWLNSDDLLADGALWEVGKAFADDPDLDLVYGNALYIDTENRPFLADHGAHRTALYYGRMQTREIVPAYWKYVHALPQPTVFFRRRLLERHGPLDESYHFIFDFELFWRLTAGARVRKLERTQAFYRIHPEAKTSDWNRFLVELYRFSRPLWPRAGTGNLLPVARDFVDSYVRRRFPGHPSDMRLRAIARLVGGSVLAGIGNPEAWRHRPGTRQPSQAEPTSQPRPGGAALRAPFHATEMIVPGAPSSRSPARRTRSFFCSYRLPRHPGFSGGETRDFNLLGRLLSLSSVEFFSLFDSSDDERSDLSECLEALHTPASVAREGRSHRRAPRESLATRAAAALRRRGVPVLGPSYHLDVTDKFPPIFRMQASLQELLTQQQPDFLFVSPQVNPVALVLDTSLVSTRFVLASYDVEAVRLERLAAARRGRPRLALELEAKRAERFERRNLARFEGVIAVSELDKRCFIERYRCDPDRILVVDNGVDPQYFAFQERRNRDRPAVVFVGSLGYEPNRDAAFRLLDGIMPLVRRRRSDAALWIVGQNPDRALLARGDGISTVVTGRVDDVRPFLGAAAVGCVPLGSGSGTKYKVLEALSAGVPLVCSPLAVEGLELEHETHVRIAGTDQEIADALLLLLDDPALAEAMARRGRARIEQRYSWAANLEPLGAWLHALGEMPRQAARSVFRGAARGRLASAFSVPRTPTRGARSID